MSRHRRYKPLEGKRFYLDVKAYRQHSQLTNDLNKLGAVIEPFFAKDLNYVITERPDYKSILFPTSHSVDSSVSSQSTPGNPSPQASASPAEPRNQLLKARGQALVERAIKQKQCGTTDVLELCRQWKIKVLDIKSVLTWIESIKEKRLLLNECKDKENSPKKKASSKFSLQVLAEPCIKFQDVKGVYRPSFRSFKSWPDINTSSDPFSCPFRCAQKSYKQSSVSQELKPVHKSCSIQKTKGGVEAAECKKSKAVNQRKLNCEICGCSFSCFKTHILTETHHNFMQNAKNFDHVGHIISSFPPSSVLHSSKENKTPENVVSSPKHSVERRSSVSGPVLSVKNDSMAVVKQSKFSGSVSQVKHLLVVMDNDNMDEPKNCTFGEITTPLKPCTYDYPAIPRHKFSRSFDSFVHYSSIVMHQTPPPFLDTPNQNSLTPASSKPISDNTVLNLSVKKPVSRRLYHSDDCCAFDVEHVEASHSTEDILDENLKCLELQTSHTEYNVSTVESPEVEKNNTIGNSLNLGESVFTLVQEGSVQQELPMDGDLSVLENEKFNVISNAEGLASRLLDRSAEPTKTTQDIENVGADDLSVYVKDTPPITCGSPTYNIISKLDRGECGSPSVFEELAYLSNCESQVNSVFSSPQAFHKSVLFPVEFSSESEQVEDITGAINSQVAQIVNGNLDFS